MKANMGGLELTGLLIFLVLRILSTNFSQNLNLGSLSGNFETGTKVYSEDAIIGALRFDEKSGANVFLTCSLPAH